MLIGNLNVLIDSQMMSDHRRAQIMGNKDEKRHIARRLGDEGQQLLQVKKNREFVERERDMAETRRMHSY